ncbi:hypothetical protein AX15_006079 [Amanita polypyramis BW_CC]|nr:hypothetical protein AX15_006079 [Amanita polypyramis BW_CC]
MLFTKTASTFLMLIFLTCASFVQGFIGDATWYYTGAGHCGAQNKDTDIIVALSTVEYGNGLRCGQQIKINYLGKTVTATVADSCPGCSRFSLDLSPAAFRALAPLGLGRLPVTWSY